MHLETDLRILSKMKIRWSGEDMYLRKLQIKDAEGMLEWMSDPQICQNFRFPMEKRSKENILNFIEKAETELVEGKSIHYAIVGDEDEYLGTISLKDINLTDRNAEFAISLRKKAQGKGIASYATKEILALAFEKFSLERVYLNVLSSNEKAIKLYEKIGFKYEGEFRNHLYLKGEYKTLKWYGMIKCDYVNRGGALVFNRAIPALLGKRLIQIRILNNREVA